MINLNSMAISTCSTLVSELNRENLEDLYNGLPYRYNSVIDLIFQENHVKDILLEKLHLTDRLFYKVFIWSTATSCLPILECLEIDGHLGGMLSTYLHDLDREILEGEGELCLTPKSLFLWKNVLEASEFSFVFPSSRSRYSRTSEYMQKIGFKERNLGRLRCFFNGVDQSEIFVDIMKELSSAIRNKNEIYSFNHARFNASKFQQTSIAKQWILTF